jgi:hypothetical protein
MDSNDNNYNNNINKTTFDKKIKNFIDDVSNNIKTEINDILDEKITLTNSFHIKNFDYNNLNNSNLDKVLEKNIKSDDFNMNDYIININNSSIKNRYKNNILNNNDMNTSIYDFDFNDFENTMDINYYPCELNWEDFNELYTNNNIVNFDIDDYFNNISNNDSKKDDNKNDKIDDNDNEDKIDDKKEDIVDNKTENETNNKTIDKLNDTIGKNNSDENNKEIISNKNINIKIIEKIKINDINNKEDNTINMTEKNMTDILRTFTNINSRLEVLAKLEGGYKIWVDVDPITGNKIFSIDNSYVPSLTRYLYSQSREKVINTIIDDTNYIQTNFSELNEHTKTVLKYNINAALQGIGNMKQTYSSNSDYTEKLKLVMETLKKYT